MWLWPEMTTEAIAKKSIKNAAYTAYWVGGLTALVALLAFFGVSHLGSPESILDAITFGVVGFFIARGSRIASILGALLYGLEVTYRVLSNAGGVSLVGIIFTLYFINGARGSFALVRLRQQGGSVASLKPDQQQRNLAISTDTRIRSCPSCGTTIWLTDDGKCPSCQTTLA